MTTDLMTLSQAAEQYGILRRTLDDRVRNGRMPGYKVDGHIYIRSEDIEAFKEQSAWSRRGMSDYAIAKQLGLSRERIRQIRDKLGLPVNPRRPTLPKTRPQ